MKKYSVMFLTVVLSAFMFFGCETGNVGKNKKFDLQKSMNLRY